MKKTAKTTNVTRRFSFLRMLALVLALALAVPAITAPTEVQAATRKFKKVSYKDVKKTTTYRTYILKVGGYGGLKGLVHSNKFLPTQKITRSEAVLMMTNYWGEEAVGTADSTSSKIATQQWMTGRICMAAEKLGAPMHWEGGNPTAKMTRGQACYYVWKATLVNKTKLLPKDLSEAEPIADTTPTTATPSALTTNAAPQD